MRKNFKIEEPEYVFFKDLFSLLADEEDVELVNKIDEFEGIKIFERRLIEFHDYFKFKEGTIKSGILYWAHDASSLLNQKGKLDKLIQGVNSGKISGLIVDTSVLNKLFEGMESLVDKVPIIAYKGKDTNYFKSRVNSYLAFCFSPYSICHGSAVEVFGEGVLVIGESGSGKSECVLELIERGHLFIADDLVKLVNYPPASILLMSGSQSESFKFFMELRGIGIIDVLRTFGPSRVKVKGELTMVVEITSEEVDRRPYVERQSIQLFGKRVPFFSFSVKERGLIPTRIETSVLEYKLKKFGFEAGQVIKGVLGGRSDKETAG
uniref:HPr kinase/phosphorylase C-terminal domain-containing protein n=1 Tax=candidate division WOR-3 bacterium TaxID=2052148 RepID=A0A7V4E6B3_UNCW3